MYHVTIGSHSSLWLAGAIEKISLYKGAPDSNNGISYIQNTI